MELVNIDIEVLVVRVGDEVVAEVDAESGAAGDDDDDDDTGDDVVTKVPGVMTMVVVLFALPVGANWLAMASVVAA